jgi:hypothetical protein
MSRRLTSRFVEVLRVLGECRESLRTSTPVLFSSRFRLGFVSVSSRFRLGFVSVLRVLGVRLESLRTSTPVLFFRSNETFVALFGVKMDDNNCKASRCEVFRGERREHGAPRRKRHRRRGAKCFEANAENTEHRDENGAPRRKPN